MSNEKEQPFSQDKLDEKIKNIEVKDEEVVKVLYDTDNPKNEISEEELYAKYDEVLARIKKGGIINRPYIKIINEEGKVANPISKDNPYLHLFPNRRQRRAMKRMEKPRINNGKSFPLIIKRVGNDFLRYHIVRQFVPENTVPVYEVPSIDVSPDPINPKTLAIEPPKLVGYKTHKARVLVHYKLASKF